MKASNMRCPVAYVCFVLLIQTAHLISPCPKLFKDLKSDRWVGEVIFLHNVKTTGVWLHLIFDKPSILLENSLGQAVTTDNKEYFIINLKHTLLPVRPFYVKFYLKYNSSEASPKLILVQLNANTVCSQSETVTEASVTMGQLISSNLISTTPNILKGDNNINGEKKHKHSVHFDATCEVPPSQLIKYGEFTHEGVFPWHAEIYRYYTGRFAYICAASLVTRYHLLMAAHCVTNSDSDETVENGSWTIFLGKYYFSKLSNPGIQEKYVDTITVHPDYNPQSFTNDIAILKMRSPVDITDYVRPVCLWHEDSQFQSVDNKTGFVVGWGFDENGRVAKQLTRTTMTIVSQEECRSSIPDFYTRFASNSTYCAAYKYGTSVFSGESGDAMLFLRTNPNLNHPVWELRGLVSIALSLQNHIVIFTDVSKYLDWIRFELEK